MKRLINWILIVLLITPITSRSQNLTGVVASTRSIDWSAVGVTGGIPTGRTQCGSTIAAYTGTPATINNAIAACTNGYVKLGAGTFSLNASICFQHSNVTLRGQGMSTILSFTAASTGSGSCTTTWQGGGDVLISIQASGNPGFQGGAPGIIGIPAGNKRNWTGTNGSAGVYTQGATVLDVSSAPTGLAAGGTLVIWQADSGSGSVPSNAWFESASTTNDPDAVAWQGAGEVQSAGMVQRVTVAGTSSTQITISSPGIYMPAGTWVTGLTPQAGWQSTGNEITGIGLENFRMTRTVGTTQMVGLLSASDSWITGCGFVPDPSLDGNYIIAPIDSRNITIQSNWIDPGGGAGGGGSTFATYGISLVETSASLVENNILSGLYAPIVMNGGSTGNVIAYNYENHITGGDGEGSSFHEEGEQMNLYEGNYLLKVWADVFHGNSNFNTMFRNHMFSTDVGFDIWSFHRWWNIIGNVINSTTYKSLASGSPKYSRWCGVAIRLGYASQHGDDPPCAVGAPYPSGGMEPTGPGIVGEVHPDTVVETSAMLWGNYAVADSTSHFTNGEVPSGIALYANTVPASQTLPSSAYLSARPSWYSTSVPFPLIGPDVTGGNQTGYGGHANKTPAQNCFVTAGGVNGSYSSSTIASFAPDACYAPVTCTSDHLTYTAQPSSATLGSSLGTVSVGVYDSGNVLCTSATTSITLAKSAGSSYGTLSTLSSLTKSAVSGVATWSDPDLTVTVSVGTGGITATATALTGATSNTFTISASAGGANAGRVWKAPIAMLFIDPDDAVDITRRYYIQRRTR